MPFRQPTSMTIHHFSFRGKVYDFPVESVLEAGQADYRLHIEASTGYWLTTLTNTTPQSQQTISYIRQPDGSWLANSKCTLLANGPSLINGSVTIRDPLGETVILTINIKPQLIISNSTITFKSIDPRKADVTRLKIIQQGAVTPVELTINNSTQFALATEKDESNFESNLTIIPSFENPYVYIRYAPTHIGRHVASLSITTPYSTKTVALQGQINSLLGWYRLSGLSSLLSQWREHTNQSVARRTQRRGVLVLLLISGLLYTSYTFRCQIAPNLCQSQNAEEPVKIVSDTALTNADAPTSKDTTARFTSQLTQKNSVDKSATILSKDKTKSSTSNLMLATKVTPQISHKRVYQTKTSARRRQKHRVWFRKKPSRNNEERLVKKDLN